MNENGFTPEYQHDEIYINDARPEDAAAIAALGKATWLETYENDIYNITRSDLETKDFDSEKRIERLRAEIMELNDSKKIWIAKEADKVIASCMVTKQPRHEVTALSVSPNSQGQGVGKKLMQKALEWLGSEESVYLVVVSYNQKGIEFYKKLGFVETNQSPEIKITVNQKQLPLLLMAKPAKID